MTLSTLEAAFGVGSCQNSSTPASPVEGNKNLPFPKQSALIMPMFYLDTDHSSSSKQQPTEHQRTTSPRYYLVVVSSYAHSKEGTSHSMTILHLAMVNQLIYSFYKTTSHLPMVNQPIFTHYKTAPCLPMVKSTYFHSLQDHHLKSAYFHSLQDHHLQLELK